MVMRERRADTIFPSLRRGRETRLDTRLRLSRISQRGDQQNLDFVAVPPVTPLVQARQAQADIADAFPRYDVPDGIIRIRFYWNPILGSSTTSSEYSASTSVSVRRRWVALEPELQGLYNKLRDLGTTQQ
jgi:hypothetical protein